jgi:hypothetical protein
LFCSVLLAEDQSEPELLVNPNGLCSILRNPRANLATDNGALTFLTCISIYLASLYHSADLRLCLTKK